MNKTEKAYGITRLKSKDVKAAIIQKITEDFPRRVSVILPLS